MIAVVELFGGPRDGEILNLPCMPGDGCHLRVWTGGEFCAAYDFDVDLGLVFQGWEVFEECNGR